MAEIREKKPVQGQTLSLPRALRGLRGQGEIRGGHPVGKWTVMAAARAEPGMWARGALWPQAQLATTGP